MAWQAQLFIGVAVHDNEEAREVFQKLGDNHELESFEGEDLEEELYETTLKRTILHKGMSKEVEIFFRQECEGGQEWPVRRTEAYSDAIVGFALTSRYLPAILDEGHVHGRPEPFEFDAHEICGILESVHEWWPEAKAMIWGVWY
jgi:hypothetical protein